MVTNRRLLTALIVVVLVGLVARFGLKEVRVAEGVYYESLPDETPSFRAIPIYTCPECVAAIYKAREDAGKGKNVDEAVSKYSLFYNEAPEDGRCPNHPDTALVEALDLPVDPQVSYGLPSGTGFLRRFYQLKQPGPSSSPRHAEIEVVISSKDRRSIHRAESCLAAQRWQQLRRPEIIELEAKGLPGGTLRVRQVLDYRYIESQSGAKIRLELVVLYWYAALPDRVTPSEYRRLELMFFDRLVRGLNYRWSYVLVSKLVAPGESLTAATEEVKVLAVEFAEAAERARQGSGASVH